MTLKGRLQDISSTQLLNVISLARKTGILTVTGEGQWLRLAFHGGKLTYVYPESTGHDLPQILWQSGKLTTAQLRTLQAHTNGLSEQKMACLLISAGYLKRSDIVESIQLHGLDIAQDLLFWTKGRFSFADKRFPPADCITIPIDLERLLITTERRRREWQRLQEELPDLDNLLRCPRRPGAGFQNIHLTLNEWRVIACSNACNTIRQIAQANRLTAYEIRRIVYGLNRAGLVEIVPHAQLAVSAS